MSKIIQIVIFGASGDLTARKLIPALFHSFCNEFFTDPIQIVGVARRPWDQETFQQQVKSKIDLSLLNPKSSSKCYRCGRTGHYSSKCYANKHVKGYYL